MVKIILSLTTLLLAVNFATVFAAPLGSKGAAGDLLDRRDFAFDDDFMLPERRELFDEELYARDFDDIEKREESKHVLFARENDFELSKRDNLEKRSGFFSGLAAIFGMHKPTDEECAEKPDSHHCRKHKQRKQNVKGLRKYIKNLQHRLRRLKKSVKNVQKSIEKAKANLKKMLKKNKKDKADKKHNKSTDKSDPKTDPKLSSPPPTSLVDSKPATPEPKPASHVDPAPTSSSSGALPSSSPVADTKLSTPSTDTTSSTSSTPPQELPSSVGPTPPLPGGHSELASSSTPSHELSSSVGPTPPLPGGQSELASASTVPPVPEGAPAPAPHMRRRRLAARAVNADAPSFIPGVKMGAFAGVADAVNT